MTATTEVTSIVDALKMIGEVESVYVCKDGNLLSVFTVIGRDDESVYDRIYDVERDLIHRRLGSHLDFNVISRRGRPVEDIVGEQTPVWQRHNTNSQCPTVTTI